MTRLEFSKLFPPCELTTNADPGISSSEYVIRGALFSLSVEMACQGQHVCAAGRYVEVKSLSKKKKVPIHAGQPRTDNG